MRESINSKDIKRAMTHGLLIESGSPAALACLKRQIVAIPPKLMKRRLLQGALLLAAMVLAPMLAERYFPSISRYVPPFVLTWLAAMSFGYALLVCRTRPVLDWLFPGCVIDLPAATACERVNQNRGARIGVVVSSALLVHWLWGACEVECISQARTICGVRSSLT